MLALNRDLYIKLFNYLSDEDLVNIFSTNKTLHNIQHYQYLWLNRILKTFEISPKILQKYRKNRSWKDYYICDLRLVNSSQTMLIDSIQRHRADRILVGLKLGADVNFPIIKETINSNCFEIIKIVINSTNIHTNRDWALRRVSRRGNYKIVKFLVENGADIHAIKDWPLRRAVSYNHLEVVKYLIEKGANIYARNNWAFRMAAKKNYTEILNILENLENHL